MFKKIDTHKTEQLIELRKSVQLTQAEAGEHFGLSAAKGRDTIRDWENGVKKPPASRRLQFISYLWETLGLREQPEEMQRLWREVMTDQWGWRALEKYELPKERPHQIRDPVGDFTGREEEIQTVVSKVRQSVASGKVTVYVVWGMGGIGKTEFAYKVAHELTDLFPGGQLLIDLRGEDRAPDSQEQVPSFLQALRSIIQTLTYDDDLPDTEKEMIARYRTITASRRVLIIADNARDAQQVVPFIPPIGSVLLITSRMFVKPRGSQTLSLDVLSSAAAEMLLLNICPRIGTHTPELARLCGYLPLALRVCAGFLDATPMRHVTIFIEQLRKERLAHLADPESNSDDPQASVEASLRLSFDALEPEMQQVMAQLSVFPTSFELEAAKAVVQGVDAVEESLEKLWRRSMMEWQETTERYTIHELIREFCIARLVEPNKTRLVYAKHYAEVAVQGANLFLNGNEPDAMMLFDREQVNIDAGWMWVCIHAGEHDTDSALLDYTEAIFRTRRIYFDNAPGYLDRFETAVEAARRLGLYRQESIAWAGLGFSFTIMGDHEMAEKCVGQIKEIENEHHPEMFAAMELVVAAMENLVQNPTEETLNQFGDGLRTLNETGNYDAVFLAITGAGFAFGEKGDWRMAVYLYEWSLEYARDMEVKLNVSYALHRIGAAYANLGSDDEAMSHYEQALDIATACNERFMIAEISWDMGRLLAQHGEVSRGLEMMQMLLDHSRESSFPTADQITAEYEKVRRKLTNDG